MPWEETDDYIRSGHGPDGGIGKTRTFKMPGDAGKQGIKAVYCVDADNKYIQSYLFPKSKGWTMETAKAWFKSHQDSLENAGRRNLYHSNAKIDMNEATRTETETHVTYKNVVITKQGVMNGTFKPRDEIELLYNRSRNFSYPVTLFHPDSVWGFVTNWVEVKGYMKVTKFVQKNARLLADISISKDNPEIIEKIDSGDYSDVSIGYFAKTEPNNGVFEDSISDEKYTYRGVERNLMINHIAILEGGTGACSVKHGCGFGAILEELDIMNVREMSRNILTDGEAGDTSCPGDVTESQSTNETEVIDVTDEQKIVIPEPAPAPITPEAKTNEQAAPEPKTVGSVCAKCGGPMVDGGCPTCGNKVFTAPYTVPETTAVGTAQEMTPDPAQAIPNPVGNAELDKVKAEMGTMLKELEDLRAYKNGIEEARLNELRTKVLSLNALDASVVNGLTLKELELILKVNVASNAAAQPPQPAHIAPAPKNNDDGTKLSLNEHGWDEKTKQWK